MAQLGSLLSVLPGWNQGLSWTAISSEAWGPFASSLVVGKDVCPYSSGTEVPVSLIAIDWGLLSAPRLFYMALPRVPTTMSLIYGIYGNLFLPGQQENIFCNFESLLLLPSLISMPSFKRAHLIKSSPPILKEKRLFRVCTPRGGNLGNYLRIQTITEFLWGCHLEKCITWSKIIVCIQRR